MLASTPHAFWVTGGAGKEPQLYRWRRVPFFGPNTRHGEKETTFNSEIYACCMNFHSVIPGALVAASSWDFH